MVTRRNAVWNPDGTGRETYWTNTDGFHFTPFLRGTMQVRIRISWLPTRWTSEQLSGPFPMRQS